MITKEVDYGIRAVLCLAEHREEGVRISAKELASTMDVPYRFLRNICRLLVDAEIVESRRGNGGGLRLLTDPALLSLFDIVQAISPRSCVLNACLMKHGACKRDNICPVHKRLDKLQHTLNAGLKEIRFDQLIG